jgi:outer membrane cobalamin receptor
VAYGSARILHGGGRVALQGVENVQAALDVSLRDGTLPAQNTDIPYFASVRTTVMASVAFADGDAYLQATGTIDGPRTTDLGGANELGSYVAVDVEGSYSVTSTIDLVLRAENLSPKSPEQWLGYPRPPAQITGGFRIRW